VMGLTMLSLMGILRKGRIFFFLHGLSPRANYTDRATAVCQRSDLPTFADRGCHVVRGHQIFNVLILMPVSNKENAGSRMCSDVTKLKAWLLHFMFTDVKIQDMR
jgi:hypothetical protein